MHNLVLAQYLVTALSSAFNACYFFGYRSSTRRRRIGAIVLGVVSIGIFIESVFFGFFALFQGQQWAFEFFFNQSYWFAARLLICLGSLAISVLILRRLVSNRR